MTIFKITKEGRGPFVQSIIVLCFLLPFTAQPIWALNTGSDRLLLQVEYYLMERDTSRAQWFLDLTMESKPDRLVRERCTWRKLSLRANVGRTSLPEKLPEGDLRFTLLRELMLARQNLMQVNWDKRPCLFTATGIFPGRQTEDPSWFHQSIEQLFCIYKQQLSGRSGSGEFAYWIKEYLYFGNEILDETGSEPISPAQNQLLRHLLGDLLDELIRQLFLSFFPAADTISSFYLDFNHYLNLLKFNQHKQTFFLLAFEQCGSTPIYERLCELYEVNYLLLESIHRSGLLTPERKKLLEEQLRVSEKVLLYYVDQYRAGRDTYWLDKLWRIAEISKSSILLKKQKVFTTEGLLSELGRKLLFEIEKTELELNSVAERQQNAMFIKLNLTLSEQYQSFYYLQNLLSPIGKENIRFKYRDLMNAVSRRKTSVVEYFESKSLYLGLYMGPQRAAIQIIPKDSIFSSALDHCFIQEQSAKDLSSKKARDLRQYYAWAQQLYAKLVSPLIGDHPPPELLIIPDGKLCYLPFEMLVVNRSDTHWEEPVFLIQYTQIRYYSSAKELLRGNTLSESTIGGLVAVVPDYRGDDIPDLKGSRMELTSIEYHFSRAFSLELLQEKSRLFHLDLDRKLIHFSMHGQGSEVAQLNGLVFTSGSSEILPAYELTNLTSPPAIAVIGACSSGWGNYLPGEGLQSIGRKFLEIGTHGVIVALSELEDRTTAEITASFYQFLAEGLSGAAALQQAKIQFLKKSDDFWEQPIFWAGLVIYGEDFYLPGGSIF